MSSILQVEFVIKELNVWSICDTNRIIRLNFLGKILQINENEIHSMCQNNKMLVVELQGGTIKAELSVIQELDSEEKVIGQCQFVAALIDSQIDKPVEFDEHAILIDSTDNLVGCIKYKIIFSTFESSMFVNKIENYPFEKCIQVDPCTTPKNVCDASLQPTFKEYLAEMNGNSLFVRVSKNSHLVERIYDANDHKSDPRKVMKSSLPLIILNAKHPGIHDCQKCLRAERCPQGVKICQKQNEDPNLDTFILKIGQKLYSNTSNSIELELKTPKLANQNAPKETKESQVVEKDLEVEQGFSKADTKKEITPKGKKSVKNVAKKKK